MNHLVRIVLVAATAAALFAGCGDDKKEASKKVFVRICADTSERLAAGTTDDFQQALENALQACSGGCDLNDKASCDHLESHLGKVCGVSPAVCEGLCEASSPSLKKYACPLAKAAPPAK